MRVNKAGGVVYGASFTAAEKKAIDIEIAKQTAEFDRKHALEFDAMILWMLHKQLGFGKKRLRRFFDNFGPELEDMINRYELDSSDKAWKCTEDLKEYGIDIEEWNRENDMKNRK